MNARALLENLSIQEDISLRRARIKRCLATIIRLPEYLRGVRGKDNKRVPLARFERCATELTARLDKLRERPSTAFDEALRAFAQYILEYYLWASAYLRDRKVRVQDLTIWKQFQGDAARVGAMI